MATEGTIRNIVRTLDRFDAHLDAMKEDDASSLLKHLKKLVKTYGIPMSKVSEGTRSSAPPPTKEVNKTSSSNRKSNTDKEKNMATASTTDVMPKSERAAYAEAHGLKLKGSPEAQTAAVHAHQKHFTALIKKGAERLIALGSKNVEGFKVDGRIKSDDKKAAAAADLILAAGYVPAGKGIAKPEDETPPAKKASTKKTSAPEEKKSSKKADAKASSKKVSSKRKARDEDEDEEDEDEDEAPVKVKKTKKVKHVEEAPKKKAKKAKVEEAPVKKSKKDKTEKVSSKKKVRRSRD